jgi:3-hydroxyacyl-[acyl-carrier-protein] dehydratase
MTSNNTIKQRDILQRLLEELPQKEPFLFLDEISEISSNHIVATKSFDGKEEFYKGHFPNDPITPGVILIEVMAQAALVALGIFLLQLEKQKVGITNTKSSMLTLFSDCSVEFYRPVLPGEHVTVYGKKIFWRRHKLRSEVQLVNRNGDNIAEGVISGQGIHLQGKRV